MCRLWEPQPVEVTECAVCGFLGCPLALDLMFVGSRLLLAWPLRGPPGVLEVLVRCVLLEMCLDSVYVCLLRASINGLVT